MANNLYNKSNSDNKKTILILGSTGSIGRNAIQVISANPKLYRVKTLVAGRNVEELIKQTKILQPDNIVIADESKYIQLKNNINNANTLSNDNINNTKAKTNISTGNTAILNICKEQHDIVIVAITGIAALAPLVAAIPHCKRIVLANKEAIVCAGSFIKALAKKYNTEIIPVDSEHNAIFQILKNNTKDDTNNKYNEIDSIILTASGGPFRNKTINEMASMSIAQALNHPNWSMGAKISIDSATMINKGLEVIEAMHLFDIDIDKIKILIHPQSLIHGIVNYIDGTHIMCAGSNDMKIPIAYSLSYPLRIENPIVNKLNFIQIAQFNFYEVDEKNFPMVPLAYKVAKIAQEGNDGPAIVLNTANEIAVEKFLKNEIHFTDIYKIVQKTVQKFANISIKTIKNDNLKSDIIINDSNNTKNKNSGNKNVGDDISIDIDNHLNNILNINNKIKKYLY